MYLDWCLELALHREWLHAPIERLVCRHAQIAERVQREGHLDARNAARRRTNANQIQTA